MLIKLDDTSLKTEKDDNADSDVMTTEKKEGSRGLVKAAVAQLPEYQVCPLLYSWKLLE